MHWSVKLFHEKTYEPIKRNKDGVKWIGHRFPIKGGISLVDTMRIEWASQKNPMFNRIIRQYHFWGA